jgi:signal transduction histidine kinase
MLAERLSKSLENGFSRLCQEALNNVAKHSKAKDVELSLTKSRDTISLSIRDEGEGFDVGEVMEGELISRGMGLRSMKERCELSGGTFSLESAKGRGTTVRASWPSRSKGGE